jgi:hypothetical protein
MLYYAHYHTEDRVFCKLWNVYSIKHIKEFFMKKAAKLVGIITLFVIIGLTMVTCDGDSGPSGYYGPSSLWGTYGYTTTSSLTIVFNSNGTFYTTGTSGTSGTYTVSGSTINLSRSYYGYYWTIIDSNRVRDGSGDVWTRRR